jgi:ADP-ribose pyrophosphatase YjhB (NUDIX family)
MGRTDYYHDPAAPAANSLVVGSSAVITDGEGRILLHRRSDSGNWALPGGAMELGETLAGCAVREVREETGFDVHIDRIIGIYSDPGHVFAYTDGEVRQEFSICLACTITGGTLTVSSESTDVRFSPRPTSQPCRSTRRSAPASRTTSATSPRCFADQ